MDTAKFNTLICDGCPTGIVPEKERMIDPHSCESAHLYTIHLKTAYYPEGMGNFTLCPNCARLSKLRGYVIKAECQFELKKSVI